LVEFREDRVRQAIDRRPNGGNLHEDLQTLPVLVEQALEGADVPFNSRDAMDELFLVASEEGHARFRSPTVPGEPAAPAGGPMTARISRRSIVLPPPPGGGGGGGGATRSRAAGAENTGETG